VKDMFFATMPPFSKQTSTYSSFSNMFLNMTSKLEILTKDPTFIMLEIIVKIEN
jgi:hypothetical protein